MEVKNHETLIRAFAKIAAAHENVKLQLIGEGELRPQMEELVKSLRIKNKVDFLGLQANVYPFLHDADTFCLPSKYEGIPMTLIEAMGTGLPIISRRTIRRNTRQSYCHCFNQCIRNTLIV